jgi:hypothetical protein
MLGDGGDVAHLHRSLKRALRRHRTLLPHQLQRATLRRTLPRDPTANGIAIHIRTLASSAALILPDYFDELLEDWKCEGEGASE